ncbi:MAG TPA: peptidylprolyl isomerase [Pirellulales bacterium]|nr:peptidylprolyl isomerase [Pirellulales bacterium]
MLRCHLVAPFNDSPNPREITMAKRAQARHILVKTKEACEDLKTQIEEGADFADLARKHSQCPSGKQGGDLGEFAPNQMVPEFDRVVFSCPVGTVQGPVKTQFGWHLLEVTSRVD